MTIRDATRSLESVAASASVNVTIGGEHPSELRAMMVSCNYPSAHLDAPVAGRTFGARDCTPSTAQPVAVLNEALWRSAFAASSSVVGQQIVVNKQRVTIVGVVPNQLTAEVPPPSLWMPYTMQSRVGQGDDYFRNPAEHAWLYLSGRLRPDHERRQAETDLQQIAAQLDRSHPGRTMRIQVTNGARIQEPFFSTRAPLLIGLVMGSLSLLLLVVCANAAILLLARAANRRQEMAIRLSLGASRARLLQQLLAETLMLALTAGAASVWLAPRLPNAIVSLVGEVPAGVVFAVDWRVLLVTLGAALLAGLAAGLSPALESLRVPLTNSLTPSGRGGSGHGSARVRAVLVSVQLAVSLALVATAGLAYRAQSRVFDMDLGYDPNTVLRLALPLSRFGYDTHAAGPFLQTAVDRLKSLPGVRSVSLAQSVPFAGQSSTFVSVTRDTAGKQEVFFRRVSPSYFESLGIRLLHGRFFDNAAGWDDMSPVPIVVSESLARRLWPTQDAIGQRLFEPAREMQVVGVVADTFSMRFGEKDGPLFYAPIPQANVSDSFALIKCAGDPTTISRAVMLEMRALDSQLLIVPEAIGAIIERERSRYALVSTLAGALAGLTLVLCLVGLYGLASFSASQRTQEVGIRLALGARHADVIRLFLTSLTTPVILGCIGGLALAVGLGGIMARARLLSDLSVIDPVTLGGASLLLVATAALATLIPARRASRVDPLTALRHE